MKNLKVSLWFLAALQIVSCKDEKKPNIVIIMSDDLGWNDVSFHGSSEIPTPNIDALAYNGVILNRFYTPPLCTPSRSSFMTGKYPTKLGMQHFVIPSDEPWGLPLNEKLVPEYFKDAGYRTALVGKWHLGFYQKAYTPTMRGFDSHFGYLGPYIGYYDYSLMMHDRNYSRGYDMRKNLSVNYELSPKPYVTELFTEAAVKLIDEHNTETPLFLMVNHLAPHAGNEAPDEPLEAPEEEVEKFNYIKNLKRRKLAAMISIMDKGVGEVVAALKQKNMMDNTVIMFYSDNGGPNRGIHSTQASNHPLRGQKSSVWEGGCRVVACIYSPHIKTPQRVSNEIMHVTDLLPTLTSLAGIQVNDPSLDGFNQWETISTGAKSPRNEILYNIEDIFGFSAVVNDGWKIVNGSENINNSGWFGSSGSDVEEDFESYTKNIFKSKTAQSFPQLSSESMKIMRDNATVRCTNYSNPLKCNPLEAVCLFNIIDDPCEENNIADLKPEKLSFLMERLTKHINDILPTRRTPIDPKCDPSNFNNTWTWWQEDEIEEKLPEVHYVVYIFIIVIFFALCCAFVRRNKKPVTRKF